jgi:hypothetical protein
MRCGILRGMTPEQVNREMLKLRQRYAALRVRWRAGERSALFYEAWELTDQVICLLD